MNLADHQRKLLGLFRSSYQASAEDGPYLNQVAKSKDLEEGRRNIFLLEALGVGKNLRAYLPFTKAARVVESAVNRFISGQNISPFRETQAPAFLESVRAGEDPLASAVASFELALAKVREGCGEAFAISWPVDPLPVLHALAQDREVPYEIRCGDFEVAVSRELAGRVLIRELT